MKAAPQTVMVCKQCPHFRDGYSTIEDACFYDYDLDFPAHKEKDYLHPSCPMNDGKPFVIVIEDVCPDKEYRYCSSCNGTGMGMTNESSCPYCKGAGGVEV